MFVLPNDLIRLVDPSLTKMLDELPTVCYPIAKEKRTKKHFFHIDARVNKLVNVDVVMIN